MLWDHASLKENEANARFCTWSIYQDLVLRTVFQRAGGVERGDSHRHAVLLKNHSGSKPSKITRFLHFGYCEFSFMFVVMQLIEVVSGLKGARGLVRTTPLGRGWPFGAPNIRISARYKIWHLLHFPSMRVTRSMVPAYEVVIPFLISVPEASEELCEATREQS